MYLHSIKVMLHMMKNGGLLGMPYFSFSSFLLILYIYIYLLASGYQVFRKSDEDIDEDVDIDDDTTQQYGSAQFAEEDILHLDEKIDPCDDSM